MRKATNNPSLAPAVRFKADDEIVQSGMKVLGSCNQRVGGSNPSCGARKSQRLCGVGIFFVPIWDENRRRKAAGSDRARAPMSEHQRVEWVREEIPGGASRRVESLLRSKIKRRLIASLFYKN